MIEVIVNQLIYPVYQINGQRISGPPKNLVCPEPSYENNEVSVRKKSFLHFLMKKISDLCDKFTPWHLRRYTPATFFEMWRRLQVTTHDVFFRSKSRIRVHSVCGSPRRTISVTSVNIFFYSHFHVKNRLSYSFARYRLNGRFIFAYKSSNKRVLKMGNIGENVNIDGVIEFCYQITMCSAVFRVDDLNGHLKCLFLHYKTHYNAAMARRALMTHLYEFGDKCYVKWDSEK